MQPVATPNDLIDALRRELEDRARAEAARFNGLRTPEGREPSVEYLIHSGERVRLISHTHPTTLLVEISAEDLAINVVLASGHEAHAGYPKQVPLVVVLKDGVPVLETQGGGPSPSEVLAREFEAFFRLLQN